MSWPASVHEHCVLDVMVKRVAVADAFEREPRRERDDLRQSRVRNSEPASHVVGQKRAKSIRRQAGQGDHHGSLRRAPAIEVAGWFRARFGSSMPGRP